MGAWLHSAIAFLVVSCANVGASLSVAIALSYGSLRSPWLDAIFAIVTFPTGMLYPLESTYFNVERVSLLNPSVWGLAAATFTFAVLYRTTNASAASAASPPDAGLTPRWTHRAFSARTKTIAAIWLASTVIVLGIGRPVLLGLPATAWLVATIALGPLSLLPLAQSAPALPQLLIVGGLCVFATLLLTGCLVLMTTNSRTVRMIGLVSAALIWVDCGSLTFLIEFGV